MAGLDTIRYIIEALRSPGIPAGVEMVNGHPRRMAGKPDLKSVNRDVNYTKYLHQQNAIGESPVDYDEWMKGQ